jgi:hypothetical protein
MDESSPGGKARDRVTYEEFLNSKVVIAQDSGAQIDVSQLPASLFPHQRAIAEWMLRGGDRTNGYADEPVVKSKADYSRSRWQIDAHGFARSSGNRLLLPEDLSGTPHDRIFKLFRQFSREHVYDFEHHVKLSERLETCDQCGHIHLKPDVCGRKLPHLGPLDSGWGPEDYVCKCRGAGRLPVTFMLLQPQSWHPDAWSDITRMLSLNSAQAGRGHELHLCPMQFDIADRVIAQFSQPGEIVFDPFVGIGTVVQRALKLGRKGLGMELSTSYFEEATYYCDAAARAAEIPSLFDMVETEDEESVPA